MAKSPSWIHTILTTGNLRVALWSECYCFKFTDEETEAPRNRVGGESEGESEVAGYEFQSTSFHSTM